MGLHRNARLGLAGRRALVADVEAGCSCREAARRRGVSPTTACKWWRRWQAATAEQRSSLVCLEDRSSRPHRMSAAAAGRRAGADLRGQAPQRLGAAADRRRDRARARDRLAGAAARRDLAAATAAARAAAPLRVALSRRSAPHRQQALRPLQPARPRGHRRPSRTGAEKRMRVGYEWVHSLVDDHSRYAYSELHRDETGSNRHRLRRARPRRLRRTRDRGQAADQRQRLRLPPQPLARAAARPPRRSGICSSRSAGPRSTAKSSATSRPSSASGALGQIYRSSDHRAQALSHWLRHYNERRPHSSLGGRPPISRVHNVPRQDS